MNENDRQRRLGDASSLQDAINSLGKVSETHRIGFVHDRLMSAIDDICKTHQGTGAAKFTPAQILIIKDVAFQMVYLLDPKNRPSRSFFKRLWVDWKEQTPLKQIALAVGALVFMGTAVTGAFGAYSGWVNASRIL